MSFSIAIGGGSLTTSVFLRFLLLVAIVSSGATSRFSGLVSLSDIVQLDFGCHNSTDLEFLLIPVPIHLAHSLQNRIGLCEFAFI